MSNTHWKKLTNPNYLGSWDVEPGQDLEIKIIRVQKELVTGVGGEKEECIVATLDGYKPMILNKTNCKTIEKIFATPYIEDWKNKSIKVYVEKVKAFGEVVDALRVRKEKVDDRVELTPDHEKWSGAVDALINGKCDMKYIKKNYRISDANVIKLEEAANVYA